MCRSVGAAAITVFTHTSITEAQTRSKSCPFLDIHGLKPPRTDHLLAKPPSPTGREAVSRPPGSSKDVGSGASPSPAGNLASSRSSARARSAGVRGALARGVLSSVSEKRAASLSTSSARTKFSLSLFTA